MAHIPQRSEEAGMKRRQNAEAQLPSFTLDCRASAPNDHRIDATTAEGLAISLRHSRLQEGNLLCRAS
jgi:hypothetical protein